MSMSILKERIIYEIDKNRIKGGDFVRVIEPYAKETQTEGTMYSKVTKEVLKEKRYNGLVVQVTSRVISIRTAVGVIDFTVEDMQSEQCIIKKLKVVEQDEY